MITGVKLVHKSGSVACHVPSYSNWGCSDSSKIYTSFVQIIDTINKIGTVLYPTNDTNNIISYDNSYTSCDCTLQDYQLNSQNAQSSELILISDNKQYQVSTSTYYALQFCEAICQLSISDNDGTAYADVYFLYQPVKYLII